MTASAGPAAAQVEDARDCNAAVSDAERIACLEAHIDALEAALYSGDAPAAPEPTAPSAPAAPTAPVAAAVPAQPATAAAAEETGRRGFGRLLPRVPFIGGGDSDGGEDATAVAAAPPAAAAPASVGGNELGSEQVALRDGAAFERVAQPREDDTVLAEIVAFERLRRGRLQVELDNGQTWRQTDIEAVSLRLREGDPMNVEIWRSGFGGYRMRVADKRPVLKVERLE